MYNPTGLTLQVLNLLLNFAFRSSIQEDYNIQRRNCITLSFRKSTLHFKGRWEIPVRT